MSSNLPSMWCNAPCSIFLLLYKSTPFCPSARFFFFRRYGPWLPIDPTVSRLTRPGTQHFNFLQVSVINEHALLKSQIVPCDMYVYQSYLIVATIHYREHILDAPCDYKLVFSFLLVIRSRPNLYYKERSSITLKTRMHMGICKSWVIQRTVR